MNDRAIRIYTAVDLVAAALEGRIRIPEFQRPLRWQWEDVRRLFDSIVKGYPIGNLLLWKRPAPEASIGLGGLRIQAKRFCRSGGLRRIRPTSPTLSCFG